MNTKAIQRRLRLHGLSARPEALEALESVLRREDDPLAAFEKIVKNLNRSSAVVDEAAIRKVVSELTRNDEDLTQDNLTVVSAFRIPQLIYSDTAKAYVSRASTAANAKIAAATRRHTHPDAHQRTQMYRDRLALMQQRLQRNPVFSGVAPPPLLKLAKKRARVRLADDGVMTTTDDEEQLEQDDNLRHQQQQPSVPVRMQMTPIEALTSGGLERGTHVEFTVCGVLTNIEENRYWLEDLTGRIPLDLSKCVPRSASLGEDNGLETPPSFGTGLFTVGAVVVASGCCISTDDDDEEDEEAEEENDDGVGDGRRDALDARRKRREMNGMGPKIVFQPKYIALPPAEPRVQTEHYTPGASRLFAGLPHLSNAEVNAMQLLQDASEDFFVLISEFHLDDPSALKAFEEILKGFAEFPPRLIALFGNFSSRGFGTGLDQISPEDYGLMFEKLADVLLRYPNILLKTDFVFVPGENDPSATPGPCWPKSCIPKCYADRLVGRVSSPPPRSGATRPAKFRFTFATNPGRVFYYNQEIVLSRDDLLEKMRRNCIVPPDPREPVAKLLVQTVVDQGHLSPLIPTIRPVYPSFDSALRLFPLPDVLVMADRYDQFHYKYEDCIAYNPGSFAADYSFVVYRPGTSDVEFSRVRL